MLCRIVLLAHPGCLDDSSDGRSSFGFGENWPHLRASGVRIAGHQKNSVGRCVGGVSTCGEVFESVLEEGVKTVSKFCFCSFLLWGNICILHLVPLRFTEVWFGLGCLASLG